MSSLRRAAFFLFAASVTGACGGRSIRTLDDDELPDVPGAPSGMSSGSELCDAFCRAATRCDSTSFARCTEDCLDAEEQAERAGCSRFFEDYVTCLLDRDVCLSGYICLDPADRLARCL